MIDKDKVVWECLRCNLKFVGKKDQKPNKCPKCKDGDTFAYHKDLVITK